MYVDRIPLAWAKRAEDQSAEQAINDGFADILGRARATPKVTGVWAEAVTDTESTTADTIDDITPEPLASFLIPDVIGVGSVIGVVIVIVVMVFAWMAWERKKGSKPLQPEQPETVMQKQKRPRVSYALTNATSRETHDANTETEPLLETPVKSEKHARKKCKDKEKEKEKDAGTKKSRRHHKR